MDNKHTPGPWKLNEEGRPIGTDGRMVGEMSALTPFTLEESARIDADRRLMCSALELLGALNAAVFALSWHVEGQGRGVAMDAEILRRARAAIDKATGGEA